MSRLENDYSVLSVMKFLIILIFTLSYLNKGSGIYGKYTNDAGLWFPHGPNIQIPCMHESNSTVTSLLLGTWALLFPYPCFCQVTTAVLQNPGESSVGAISFSWVAAVSSLGEVKTLSIDNSSIKNMFFFLVNAQTCLYWGCDPLEVIYLPWVGSVSQW